MQFSKSRITRTTDQNNMRFTIHTHTPLLFPLFLSFLLFFSIFHVYSPLDFCWLSMNGRTIQPERNEICSIDRSSRAPSCSYVGNCGLVDLMHPNIEMSPAIQQKHYKIHLQKYIDESQPNRTKLDRCAQFRWFSVENLSYE